jgi:hypothetical protein
MTVGRDGEGELVDLGDGLVGGRAVDLCGYQIATR